LFQADASIEVLTDTTIATAEQIKDFVELMAGTASSAAKVLAGLASSQSDIAKKTLVKVSTLLLDFSESSSSSTPLRDYCTSYRVLQESVLFLACNLHCSLSCTNTSKFLSMSFHCFIILCFVDCITNEMRTYLATFTDPESKQPAKLPTIQHAKFLEALILHKGLEKVNAQHLQTLYTATSSAERSLPTLNASRDKEEPELRNLAWTVANVKKFMNPVLLLLSDQKFWKVLFNIKS
jgi:hypothetical protein